MRDFMIIFKFELRETLKKKSLVIATLVLAVLAFLAASIPSFMVFSGNDDTVETPPVADNEIVKMTLDAAYTFANPQDYAMVSTVLEMDSLYDDEDSLIQAIKAGEENAGFVVESLNSYKYIVVDNSLLNTDQQVFEELLRSIQIAQEFEALDIDYNQVITVMAKVIDSEVVTLGKDSSMGLPIGFIIMLVLYMIILMYGNGVSTSVAREKDSRTMELLITSTNTKDLILGKVLAAGLAGVLQMSVIIGALLIGFALSKPNYPPYILAFLQGSMSFDIIMVYLLFSVAGYMLYLFIFAALGSLVSKVEDVASATTPITILFVIAYFIASMSMQMPDSIMTVVSSYIPFVSTFTMPIRYMLTTVSSVELLISMAIMLVTCILFAVLSIMIYRYGSLNYGNKLKISKVIKDLIKDR